jgi:glutamine cyclotransferase
MVLLLCLGGAVAAQDGRTWLDEHLRDPFSPSAVPTWDFEVVETYPHDPEAFTQGLVYRDGVLYEGTGLNGESSLRRVELETGQILQQIDLDEDYFGEGIAVIDDRIYQITWRNETAFLYDRETFEQLETFHYSGDGWGLTWNGEHLVMSNGSNVIVFRDPETFLPVRQIEVHDNGTQIASLNELEWVDGEIWANVYTTDWIVRIDPETGAVTGWIDLAGLLLLDRDDALPGPLNGIAWDAETDRLFVTGKNWPTLFEIDLIER